jgi:hypothetical protein
MKEPEKKPEKDSTPLMVSWAAAIMGKKGGKSTSPKKQAAVRENGKKGGYHKRVKP